MTFRSAAARLWEAEPWIFLATLPWLLFTEVSSKAAVVALVVFLLLIGARTIASGVPIKASSFSLPAVLILFTLPFSLWSAPDLQFAIPKLAVILAGVIAFALFVSRPQPEDGIRWALWIALGTAVAIVPLAIVGGEWAARKVLPLDALYQIFPRLVNQVPRSVAGGFHPNEIAGTLVLLLFPMVGLALDPSPLRSPARLPVRWGLRLLVGGLAFLLLLTQSRGAWVATWLAAVFFVGRSRARLQFVLLGAGATLLALLFALRTSSLAPQVVHATTFDFEGLVSALDRSTVTDATDRVSWLARLEIWTRAAMIFRDYPILSSGLYQFGLISSTFYGYMLAAPEFRLYHAHNLYAQSAADFGLVGVVFWGLVAAWLLHQCRRPMTYWERGIVAGLVAFMLHGLTDAIPLGQKPTFLFWLLIVPLAVRSVPGAKLEPNSRWPQLLVGGSLLGTLAVPLWLPVWHANVAALVLNRPVEVSPAGGVLASRWRRSNDAIRAGLLLVAYNDEKAARAAWAQSPPAANWLVWRGRVALANDNLPEAELWFDRALQHPDASAAAALGMAQVQLGQDSAGEAATSLRVALQLPGTPAQYATAWQQLGALLAQEERWAEAADALEAALRQQPTASVAFELGVAELQRGNRQEAEAAFATVRRLSGDSPSLLTRIGEAYRRAGDRDGAARLAELVIQTFPTSPLGYRLQARLAMDAEEWVGAASWLERGLQQAPADDGLWYELARVRLKRDEPQGALQAVQTAISYSTEARPLYFVLLGDIRRHLGDQPGAEEAYRTALRINPSHPVARERLTHCCQGE